MGRGESELRETLAKGGAGMQGRGQGEEFSKQGRVNWSLARRIQLLAQVRGIYFVPYVDLLTLIISVRRYKDWQVH